jgi:hypothetical protein
MTKLSHTSETAIAITFLVMNLSTWLWRVFCVFLQQSWIHYTIFRNFDYLKLCLK